MQKALAAALVFVTIQVSAQEKKEAKPIEIFSSTKTINARTTELVGKGKLDFNVSHNFGDVGGSNGGIKRFFGLDNASDIRIAFTMGLGNNLDLNIARAKGAGPQQQLYETGIKYRIMQQRENDPSHPLSIALYGNMVIAASPQSAFPNQDNSYDGLGERMSNVLQLILAKKMGKVSLQLNPTFVTRGYAISYDQKNFFALGGAVKLPLGGRVNLLLDYFHPFRSETSKNAFKTNDNIKFRDPLGVGFEILTSGHIFRLNFTNATELLENRFIPRTITSWGKGQFRWGFTISRKFRLWTAK
ncbi:MAG: hypothetical protein IPG86_18330 [Chitinophagaceae bacterium]|jgi:Membrane bound beta barrel domain (DUF5777)|nr:hypothetical protein [Chitinophagaceae bacterium]